MRQSFQVKTIKSSETNQVISYLSLLPMSNLFVTFYSLLWEIELMKKCIGFHLLQNKMKDTGYEIRSYRIIRFQDSSIYVYCKRF